ncbi:MAG TPA: acyl-CoA dehydrogenase family protein [Chloroflexia bacterium]|nr:acyl-CoA dehydrogenase family protein [Chloroflexia bacterium]
MDYNMPSDILEMKQATHDLVYNFLIPLEPELEKTGEVPPQALQQLRELGYYGITIPEEYGGMGLGQLAYCSILEELAQAHEAFSSELGIANGLGSHSLLAHGNQAQKDRYLRRIAAGEIVTAFALSEPQAGSDAANIQTTATKVPGGWNLNGSKLYITNAVNADLFTVIAVNDREKRARGGITAFLVERNTPGFKVAQILETMGSKPYNHGELVFEDCFVPDENVLGVVGEGFKIAMETLDEGRLHVAASACGVAERLLQMSVEWSQSRQAFGQPIAVNQGIQWMLSDSATELYAAQQMLYNACWRLDQGERVTKQCAMTKLFATEMVGRVADRAVQIHGGMGYMRELPVERMYRDVRVMRIYEGTSEIQRIVIARELLKGNLK